MDERFDFTDREESKIMKGRDLGQEEFKDLESHTIKKKKMIYERIGKSCFPQIVNQPKQSIIKGYFSLEDSREYMEINSYGIEDVHEEPSKNNYVRVDQHSKKPIKKYFRKC